MKVENLSPWLRRTLTTLFFVVCFIYFFLFCRYHLAYQEQVQLFMLDKGYFLPFLSHPGGLMQYFSAFLIQFYLYPWLAALVVTLSAFGVFLASRLFLNRIGMRGLLWALLPPLFIIALQVHHSYHVESTIAFLLVVLYASLHFSLTNSILKYLYSTAGWALLYVITGAYAFIANIAIVLFEIFYRKSPVYSPSVILILVTGGLAPILAARFLWYINPVETWTALLPLNIHTSARFALYALMLWFPVLMTMHAIIDRMNQTFGKSIVIHKWQSALAGCIVIILSGWWIQKKAYDAKTEILLGIDHSIQQHDWSMALRLSSMYPGSNRMVTYFTNMALYEKGWLGDRMFNYRQMGSQGLYLNWKNTNLASFFGSELYYRLSYTNEAFRWAFETMVSDGLNPRCVKQLALTSIINGDKPIAMKYLDLLEKTIFYRNWALTYKASLTDTGSPGLDPELAARMHLSIRQDFWADDSHFDVLMSTLLNDHPDNRMAFEYYMASQLLDLNYSGFASNLVHLKDFGYFRIPQTYEEALLIYMALYKKNAIPAGYTISDKTRVRFANYMHALSQYGNDRRAAAKALFKQYGKTFWYYASFEKGK